MQSLCNKAAFMLSVITENKLDLLIFTKSWLYLYDGVIRKLATPPMCTMKYIPRQNGFDGGTGILCRTEYRPILISSGMKSFYEFSEYSIKISNKTFLILVIYCPPC